MKTQKEFNKCVDMERSAGYRPTARDIEFYKMYWQACEELMIEKLKNCFTCKHNGVGVFESEGNDVNCSLPIWQDSQCIKKGFLFWEMED